ncbi:uncharacterized protein STEHIDRAFT_110627 [Stereum hirsutum FP-91666 SS1]|uniref:uncharacterized protein n=1 Tax=Stereum hirsutum (strain FP-91666) TaxID=721885 RepID=UPI000440E87D|nr:uncharacterized protein STEHIDRAFT_110627 [Stereum hirsutum FP-91666 SS1]EIM87405.1 hypothetical protein STEHIDRAFT_110627 [Stereum hirsutum FP-91666 SS1]
MEGDNVDKNDVGDEAKDRLSVETDRAHSRKESGEVSLDSTKLRLMETEQSEIGAAKAEYDLCYVDLRLRYEFYVWRIETVMVLTIEHCPKFQTEKHGLEGQGEFYRERHECGEKQVRSGEPVLSMECPNPRAAYVSGPKRSGITNSDPACLLITIVAAFAPDWKRNI